VIRYRIRPPPRTPPSAAGFRESMAKLYALCALTADTRRKSFADACAFDTIAKARR
jgi:hypothetical protein